MNDNFLLKILQKIYLILTTTERFFFKVFSFLVHKPKATVISIGNLSMGGTGKTPVLFELLENIQNKRVAVISRGYKSPWERSFYLLRGNRNQPADMTDEALLFNRKYPEIPIFLGKNRHHSSIMAEKLSYYDYIILDDGFQYRRLKKDINIVLWDSTTKIEDAKLLPQGRLREPIERLKDSTVILLTRCEISSEETVNLWVNWLTEKSNGKPVIKLQTVFDGFIDALGHKHEIESDCLAFAAIGNPDSFFTQLSHQNINIIEKKVFQDHHKFTLHELEYVVNQASKKSLQIICTEKDLIKIPTQFALKHRILAMKIRSVPLSQNSLLAELQKSNIFISDKEISVII